MLGRARDRGGPVCCIDHRVARVLEVAPRLRPYRRGVLDQEHGFLTLVQVEAGDVGCAQALHSGHGQVHGRRASARAALPDMEIALNLGLIEADPAPGTAHVGQVHIPTDGRVPQVDTVLPFA